MVLGAAGAVLSAACACGRTGPVPTAQRGVLDLRARTAAATVPVELKGEWEFYWKSFEPEPGTRPSAYGPIDRNWRSAFSGVVPGIEANGYALYRLRVRMPESARDHAWAIHSRGQTTSLEIRRNGLLLLQSGRPGVTATETIERSGRGTAFFRLDEPTDLVLDVRIANHVHPLGGAGGQIYLGTAAQIERIKRQSAAGDWFVATGLFLFAIYHLGMFVIRREERVALFFALLCLIVSFRTLVLGEFLLAEMFALPWALEFRLGALTYFVTSVCALYYIHYLFPRPRLSLLVHGMALVGALASAAVFLPLGQEFVVGLIRWYHFNALAIALYALGSSVYALVRGESGSRIVFGGILALVGAAVHDILANLGVVHSAQILQIVLMLFVASQALLIYGRFSEAFSDVETLSHELSAANEALERLSSVKDEFMANLSHELRTPLTLIRASAEMIEMGAGNGDSARASAQRILNGSDTLIGYMDDLMLVTDVETVPDMQQAAIDVSTLISEVSSACSETASARSVHLSFEAPPGLELSGDRRLIGRALYNVIKNAVIYNRPGGTVHIRGERSGDFVRIVVTDSGIGIEAEHLPHVWEKFYRADRFADSGVGLGLFLTRKIVELHGGTVSLTSRFGQGTTVEAMVPVAAGAVAGAAAGAPTHG